MMTAWDELTGSLDFATLRGLYASGTVRPSDVVRAVYRRIAARGEDHVFIHLVPLEDALAAAARLETEGRSNRALWGFPCAIKDNIDVPGLPSTSAFPPSKAVAERTGPAISRLIEAGALIIGKTNLDQLAVGLVGVRSPYGVARNAFDGRFIPGGSSSGSGVAVGAGLVSFALGNDAAGSGRVPAAFNNIVGVKPTPGLVSNTAVVGGGTAKSLETISVFGLTVSDGMEVLRLIAGFDPHCLFSNPQADLCDLALRPVPDRIKVATPRASDLAFDGDTAAARLFEEALARVERLGGEIVEVSYSLFDRVQRMLYEAPFLAERSASLAPLIAGREHLLHPVTRQILSTADGWTAIEAYRAIHELAGLKRDIRRLLAGCDVFLVPTTPTIYRVAEVEADPIVLNARLGTYTNFVNLIGFCGVAVPAGFRPDGMPLGVTVLAPGFREADAASFAAVFQNEADLPLGATGARIARG